MQPRWWKVAFFLLSLFLFWVSLRSRMEYCNLMSFAAFAAAADSIPHSEGVNITSKTKWTRHRFQTFFFLFEWEKKRQNSSVFLLFHFSASIFFLFRFFRSLCCHFITFQFLQYFYQVFFAPFSVTLGVTLLLLLLFLAMILYIVL